MTRTAMLPTGTMRVRDLGGRLRLSYHNPLALVLPLCVFVFGLGAMAATSYWSGTSMVSSLPSSLPLAFAGGIVVYALIRQSDIAIVDNHQGTVWLRGRYGLMSRESQLPVKRLRIQRCGVKYAFTSWGSCSRSGVLLMDDDEAVLVLSIHRTDAEATKAMAEWSKYFKPDPSVGVTTTVLGPL